MNCIQNFKKIDKILKKKIVYVTTLENTITISYLSITDADSMLMANHSNQLFA